LFYLLFDVESRSMAGMDAGKDKEKVERQNKN
jgi:hypothetical protein